MARSNDTLHKAQISQAFLKAKGMLQPQDYPGLDAAGFLLVALGHLVKAKEKLDQEPPARNTYRARWETTLATNHVRYALALLDELKEETCEKL